MTENRQDIIKEYAEYGFSEKEIAKKMQMDISLVKEALRTYGPLRTETPSKSSRGYLDLTKSGKWKEYATDRERTFLELLYEYGPKELNRLRNNFGLCRAAEWLRIE